MPETPLDLLNADRLADAIAATADTVRSRPTETKWRGLLAELYCLNGEYERAENQLETLTTLNPGAAVGASLMRQLIRAAVWRDDCFSAGRPPEVVAAPGDVVRNQLEMNLLLREGKTAEAAATAARINETRSANSGTLGDVGFQDFRDVDDSWAGVLEVMTSTGKYYWVPLEAVEAIDVQQPSAPRDLIWAPANLEVRNGPQGAVFLPAIYPTTPRDAPAELRLGRASDWIEEAPDFTRGRGARMFWLDDEAKTLFELQAVRFHANS